MRCSCPSSLPVMTLALKPRAECARTKLSECEGEGGAEAARRLSSSLRVSPASLLANRPPSLQAAELASGSASCRSFGRVLPSRFGAAFRPFGDEASLCVWCGFLAALLRQGPLRTTELGGLPGGDRLGQTRIKRRVCQRLDDSEKGLVGRGGCSAHPPSA